MKAYVAAWSGKYLIEAGKLNKFGIRDMWFGILILH